MKEIQSGFSFKELESESELPVELQVLLQHSVASVKNAYAPYSDYAVGAAALLENGKIVSGSNQENASSPVGICAERVTLSAASAAYPGITITALAITVKSPEASRDPVAPCGLCRQTILEYEERGKKNIQLILRSQTGKISWISSAKDLLPLYFSSKNLLK